MGIGGYQRQAPIGDAWAHLQVEEPDLGPLVGSRLNRVVSEAKWRYDSERSLSEPYSGGGLVHFDDLGALM